MATVLQIRLRRGAPRRRCSAPHPDRAQPLLRAVGSDEDGPTARTTGRGFSVCVVPVPRRARSGAPLRVSSVSSGLACWGGSGCGTRRRPSPHAFDSSAARGRPACAGSGWAGGRSRTAPPREFPARAAGPPDRRTEFVRSLGRTRARRGPRAPGEESSRPAALGCRGLSSREARRRAARSLWLARRLFLNLRPRGYLG